MANENYFKIRSYLYFREPVFYRDVCHDAYVSYYNTTGLNLFEQPIALAKLVAKRKLYEYWKSTYFTKDGSQVGKREFLEFSAGEDGFSAHAFNNITPDLILEGKELEERIQKFIESLPEVESVFIKDKNILKKIVQLRVRGFTNKEVAEELNISKGLVTYYLKKVNLELMINPFNGNPTKVIKRITRETFDRNPKYKEEFEEGDGADYNEYYTLLTSKENPKEGLLIREIKDEKVPQ